MIPSNIAKLKSMKLAQLLKLSTFASALLLAATLQAADTVKLENVHVCCNACVKGVDKALTGTGATAVSDKDAGTVVITAPDKATAQKGVNALVAAGYYGKTSDASVKLDGKTGAKGQKVEKLVVADVHLCCAKCVTAVNKAVSSVPGVKANTAEKNVKTFEVTGSFNDKEVFDALQKAGLTGKVAN
jgi:copper chaperone CopZ